MTFSIELLDGFYGELLLLFAVILIRSIGDKLIPLNPLRYFRLYSTLLANKVNKPTHSNTQLKTSGIAACLVTIVPIVIILWTFELLVELVWLWHGLLLWMSVGWFSTKYEAKVVHSALIRNQKQYAKDRLSNHVLRQTDALSPLGLSKAAIESSLFRFNSEFFTVAFCYLLLGPLAAFTYRLLYEMHLSWNPKLPRFRHFGQLVTTMVNLIQWPMAKLISLVSIFSANGGHLTLFLRLTAPYFWRQSSFYLLQSHALSLGIALGGPAIYEKNKTRTVVANPQGRQPAAEDIVKSISHLHAIIYFAAMLLISSALLHWLLTTKVS